MRAALLCFCISAGWGQDTGAIESTVTSAATHAPIAGARITVSGKNVQRAPDGPLLTDAAGRVRIDGLLPGDYTLHFSAGGFAGAASETVHVGSTTVRVNAELLPAAVLRGRVVDDEGRPVAAIPVEVYCYRACRPRTVAADSQGRFEIETGPGVYAVAARPANQQGSTTLAPTWFPGTADRAQAERVIARSGAEVSGLEIRLRRVPVWTVEGVTQDEQGHALASVSLRLRPDDEWQPDEIATKSGPDGAFRFEGVRPGEWRLIASAPSGREGYATVRVDKHEVGGLAVRLFPPFVLEGFVDREEPRDAAGNRKLSGVSLIPEAGQGRQALAFHEQNGAIRFPKVQPGRYTIFPLGYIPGYYVESVKLGDRDVMARPIDLNDGAIPFRVTYRPNAGRVRGSVEKGGGSTVALLPQDESFLNGQFIRTVSCDSNGRFEVGSLKPGEYYAFAFDRVDRAALEDVGFVRNLRSQAVLVHVEAGKAANVELKVTEWPE